MIDLTVPDMTCGHCASAIARAVKDLDAAGACDIDLRAKRVRISSALPAADFIDALREAGYSPAEAAGQAAP